MHPSHDPHLVCRQDAFSPLSADNVAARDAVFQLLSLRRALERLGRAGASTLFAGMALAATGGPVEVHYQTSFDPPVTTSRWLDPEALPTRNRQVEPRSKSLPAARGANS